MRHTRSHTGNRRSHHALKGTRFSVCENCSGNYIKHHACESCGKYKGRQVLDVNARIAKMEKRKKAKNKELGIEPKKE